MNLFTSLLRKRLNLFYLLAFMPLLLIQFIGYISRGHLFAILIPLYGFLLLLIKKDKLAAFAEPSPVHRLLGLTLILASFFTYYAVVFFFPSAQFYGVANYIIYIIGLLFFFFEISALKESFAPIFLIAAAVSSTYIGEWMKPHLEPSVPYFARLIGFVLPFLGIPIKTIGRNAFSLQMPDGRIMNLGIAAGCIGIDSFLAFAIIIVVIMMEDPSNLRTKVLWSVAGVIGTFIVNIVRVSLIFAVIYYFGFENWGEIHSRIGYVLFIAWLAIFFLIFSKRQVILTEFQRFWRRIRKTDRPPRTQP